MTHLPLHAKTVPLTYLHLISTYAADGAHTLLLTTTVQIRTAAPKDTHLLSVAN